MVLDLMVIISGSLAAILALVTNRFLVKFWGDTAIAFFVPIGEEILKTSLALIFNTSIVFTHLTFGFLEAIWDIKKNFRGLKPGLVALLTHSFFGLITWYGFKITGYVSIGLIASILLHVLWNFFIIKRSGTTN